MTSTEAEIDRFLGEYTSQVKSQLQAARERLRAIFPRGYELVFNNYNALVFGFSPTESSRDAFISVAGYPRWVTLFFLSGTALQDPLRLLEGKGKQVRSIRLKSADDIDTPPIRALIEQALEPHRAALRVAPPRVTLLKTAVQKQRSRRPR